MKKELLARKNSGLTPATTNQLATRPFAPPTAQIQAMLEGEETSAESIQRATEETNLLSRVTTEPTPTVTPSIRLKQVESPIAANVGIGENIQTRTASNNLLARKLDTPPATTSQPRYPIQAKLTLGAPGDKYELEADRVARQVVDSIYAPLATNTQVGDSNSGSNESGAVRRQISIMAAGDAGGEISSEWEGELNRARGGGQPLSQSVREPMERGFGADFSGVRVHTGAQADMLARSIQAKAFTTGQDVFFRQGAYEPGSRAGQELIAHELTHVVQQNGGEGRRRKEVKAEKKVRVDKGEEAVQRVPGGSNGSEDCRANRERRNGIIITEKEWNLIKREVEELAKEYEKYLQSLGKLLHDDTEAKLKLMKKLEESTKTGSLFNTAISMLKLINEIVGKIVPVSIGISVALSAVEILLDKGEVKKLLSTDPYKYQDMEPDKGLIEQGIEEIGSVFMGVRQIIEEYRQMCTNDRLTLAVKIGLALTPFLDNAKKAIESYKNETELEKRKDLEHQVIEVLLMMEERDQEMSAYLKELRRGLSARELSVVRKASLADKLGHWITSKKLDSLDLAIDRWEMVSGIAFLARVTAQNPDEGLELIRKIADKISR